MKHTEVTQQQSKGWFTNPTERVINCDALTAVESTSQKKA